MEAASLEPSLGEAAAAWVLVRVLMLYSGGTGWGPEMLLQGSHEGHRTGLLWGDHGG